MAIDEPNDGNMVRANEGMHKNGDGQNGMYAEENRKRRRSGLAEATSLRARSSLPSCFPPGCPCRAAWRPRVTQRWRGLRPP